MPSRKAPALCAQQQPLPPTQPTHLAAHSSHMQLQTLVAGSCAAAAAAGARLQSARKPHAQPARSSVRRRPRPPQAGLFGDLFDFESWAPKSSQAWRLGNNPHERRTPGGRRRPCAPRRPGSLPPAARTRWVEECSAQQLLPPKSC